MPASEIGFTGSLVFDELSETDLCSHVVRRHNKGRQPNVDHAEIGSPGGWRAAGSRMWPVGEVRSDQRSCVASRPVRDCEGID